MSEGTVSLDRVHYYVVYRRYLRVTATGKKSIIKYLNNSGWRVSWITDPTKALHCSSEEEAFRWADKYHANVTHMSEAQCARP